MERLAISGSHGFIGSRLLERLEQSKYKVDRLGRNGCLIGKPDIVFDLAAYGNMYDQKDLRATYRTNLMRVITSLEDLPKESRFIYVSTSSVMLPTQTYYSASKRATEEMLRVWDGNYAIVRPFSITGVGEQKEHLIPKLIDSCMNETEMPFVPEPVHDFLDVEDLIEALMIIAKSKEKGIFQVGSGLQHSNREVKEIIEGVVGKKANVTVVSSLREYDAKEWRADISRMYSLGWEPKKSLEQSIKEMYEYEN